MFRTASCWVLPLSIQIRDPSLHASVVLSHGALRLRAPSARFARQLRGAGATRMMADEGADETKRDEDDGKGKANDWDASWTEFSKKRTGGVFELSGEDDTDAVAEVVDKRVENLTNAWSSENGFLVGIAVILLIVVFYVYVYETGGISH